MANCINQNFYNRREEIAKNFIRFISPKIIPEYFKRLYALTKTRNERVKISLKGGLTTTSIKF